MLCILYDTSAYKSDIEKKIEKPTLESNEDKRAYLQYQRQQSVPLAQKGCASFHAFIFIFMRRLYTIINVVGSNFKTAG